ncbi:MAG TPA: hypothetical protein OIM35_03305 [Clostridiaceae bacterium]|nr:hypothetical protein [Clostridiaceae bacterium]
MNKLKKLIKKLSFILIVSVTMLTTLESTFAPYEIYADTTTTTTTTDQAKSEQDLLTKTGSAIGTAGDFLVGLALYIPKAMAMGLASLLRVLVYGITSIGSSGDGIGSVDAIIFNEAEITSIDFFDTSSNGTVNKIRENISIWYYVFRNLSIVILLGILLYVGIRMAMSTVASDEAKYKKMFKDWVVSLALVFVLQYIMIFTIGVNNVLVDVLNDARNNVQTSEAGKQYDNALDQIASQAWNVDFTVGVSSTLVYIILVGITILFLIMYIKRMLTIGFLIVISPLITITYSIDKMGDGKSQALNAWLKEFVFNVLIQPFHCIIYLIFASTAINLLTEQQTLAAAVLSICMILFIFKGEKIVREIFNFRASSLGEAIGGAAAITTGISMLKARGEKDKKKNIDTKKLPKMEDPGKKTGKPGGTQPGGTQPGGTQPGGTQPGGTQPGGTQPGETQPGGTQPGETQPGGTQLGGTQPAKRKTNKFVAAVGKIKAGASKAVNSVEEAYDGLPPAIKGTIAASAKIATVGTLAALGASTGSSKGALAGMHAGNSLAEGAGGIASSRKANRLVMDNEESFAQAYQNYRQSTGYTNDQIATKTEQYLNGDIKAEEMNDADKEYFSYASKMQKTYKVVGEEDTKEKMQETLGLIAAGQIQPPKQKVPKKRKPKK